MTIHPPDDIRHIQALHQIVTTLRDKENGCSWDIAQNADSIRQYTIEEAYEVVDAIEHGSPEAVCDELGDLLLQVVFHAQIAQEAGQFTLADVIESICAKMIHRHPHVFKRNVDSTAPIKSWEDIKAAERDNKATRKAGALDDVPIALPALMRAVKLQNRAARVGFDWPTMQGVLDKLHEEIAELAQAQDKMHAEAIVEEFGDVLFTLVNVARHLQLDAEQALRQSNTKFQRRFEKVESQIAEKNQCIEQCSLAELEMYWQKAKAIEKASKPASKSAT